MSLPAPDLPAASAPIAATTAEERPKLDAVEYVARPHFHQRLTLPATDAHGELTVTYAVAGNLDSSAPTLLFIGGMFGGRYLAVFQDYVCKKLGVRMVSVDRPGMGGSTSVPVPQRIPVWLETVPVLMKAVRATHVALASHSCGVIYAFNTIYTMPHILLPDRPALYLFAPWVPPVHSKGKLMGAASLVPSSLIGRFDSVVGFVSAHVAQPVGMSGTAIAAVAGPIANMASGLFASDEARQQKREEEEHEKTETTARLKEYCGCNSSQEATALGNEIMRRMFDEFTTGGNDEALLCLRKPEAGPWGECESYEGFPERLNEKLKETFWKDGMTPKVLIKAIWAETDIMFGKGGENYLNKCFDGFAVPKETASLVYHKESVPKTDHDSVMLPQNLAMPRVLKDILGTDM